MTDEEALELARRGREEGFRAIYLRYSGFLFTLALKILRNQHSAEDAVQEAFSSAFRSLSEFRGDARLKTWLYTILYRAALKIRMKGQPEVPTEEIFQEVISTGHGSVENQMDVQNAMDRLEARDKAVLMMAYWDDLSCKEIGEVLGLKENHVKVLLFRAREKFSTIWGEKNNKRREMA